MQLPYTNNNIYTTVHNMQMALLCVFNGTSSVYATPTRCFENLDMYTNVNDFGTSTMFSGLYNNDVH